LVALIDLRFEVHSEERVLFWMVVKPAYLVAAANVIVSKLSQPMSDLKAMNYGNYPGDRNHLTLGTSRAATLR
jgi:hypothetical protein